MSIIPPFVENVVTTYLTPLLDWFSERLYADLIKRVPDHLLVKLHEHGVYLERHPSEFFSANNHVVGEELGLLLLGSLFPVLPRAERWEERGWRWLEQDIGRQYHPDGGSTEQATCYHHYSLGLFLQAALLRRNQGKPVGQAFRERLEKIFDFSLHMTRPDGKVPMIGDNDDAVACPIAAGAIRRLVA